MDKLLCEHVHEFLDLELHEITLLLRRDNIALYRILRADQAKNRQEEA
jgi:hypothetical protein